MDPRRKVGKRGEETVRRLLEERRFRILAANFRCPFGELDLVAWDGESVVFVEVKTRKGGRGMEQALGRRQEQRIRKAARFFLHHADLHEENHRFLLALVYLPVQRGEKTRIRLVEDPF